MEELKDLGYHYDDEGTLRDEEGNQFSWKGQEQYDKLANAVLQNAQDAVSAKMETRKLKSGCPIFVSNLESKRILVIIQGSGRVRAGVWGCAICINEIGGLKKGTMISYIDAAQNQNYGIVILNPNWVEEGAPLSPRTGVDHVKQAWNEVVVPLLNEGATIDVVAHSNGGRCFMELITDECMAKTVRRVAFTDSYHHPSQVQKLGEEGRKVLGGIRNYVPSEKPLDEPVEEWVSLKNRMTRESMGVQCLSAQCGDHAMTNFGALGTIMAWFSSP